MTATEPSSLIPATLLPGFLGSGKMTAFQVIIPMIIDPFW
jgi:hypothetical protein